MTIKVKKLTEFERLDEGYYVGDPCYVLGSNDDLWSKICRTLWDFDKQDNQSDRDGLVLTIDGVDIIIWGTAHGDGGYKLTHNKSQIGRCGVDAGLLSFIPTRLGFDKLGVLLQELPDGTPDIEGGNMEWGPLAICTSGDDWD